MPPYTAEGVAREAVAAPPAERGHGQRWDGVVGSVATSRHTVGSRERSTAPVAVDQPRRQRAGQAARRTAVEACVELDAVVTHGPRVRERAVAQDEGVARRHRARDAAGTSRAGAPTRARRTRAYRLA